MILGVLTNQRAVEWSDLDLIHRWLDDPELMSWWGYGVAAPSRAAIQIRIEQWIEEEVELGHPIAFVAMTLEGKSIGLVVLSDLQPIDRSAEISLFLERHYRGTGLGGDIIESLCDAAFDQWNIHRLTARSEAANEGAHSFFVQHEFAMEGRLRDARYVDGGWHDILIFGRVNDREIDS